MEPLDIRRLNLEELAEHVDDFISIAADVPDEYWRQEHFLIELPHKWALSLAAWEGRSPIAYAIISGKPDANAHLHHFMVSAAWRGRGCGPRILEAAFANCRKYGYPALTLKVATHNEAAHRFYTR